MSKANVAISVGKSVVMIGSKIIKSKSAERITPHIVKHVTYVIEPVSKKAEYLPDIIALISRGKSISEIAELLNMSQSYVYKLLSIAKTWARR